MSYQFNVIGLGEALFDIFPDGQILGGAPLNAAVHAHQIAASHGGCGLVVSRVGQDALGDRVRQELAERGIVTEYMQTDPDRPTGKVHVTLNEEGHPEYDIVSDVAWDWIQWDPDLEMLASRCDAVCFSSLAQRHSQSRSSIQRFLSTARHAIRLFDLTLRQQFYDRSTLRRSCELSTVVKCNLEELEVLSSSLDLRQTTTDERAAALRSRFDLKAVVITRGPEGTLLYTASQRYDGASVDYRPMPDADTVGAGDACTAAIVSGMILRRPMQQVVDFANHVGAYVASVRGATPTLPETILNQTAG